MKKLILLTSLLILLFSPHLQIAKADTEDTGDVLSFLIPSIALGETIFYEEGHEGSVEFLKAFVTSQIITEGLKTTIHKRYGFKYSVPAYIAASYVAYSRVDADKHEVEDVIAGALVGILSSYYFVEPYKGFTITPVAEDGMYGVSFRKQF